MMIRDPKDVEGSPRAEVLKFVQRHGSSSVKDLEAELGVTTTAVREQVAHLLHEGLLLATRVRGEIGRPYYVYSLTPKAQELFPKDYASLAQLLLEETLTLHGPEGLRSLLNRVSCAHGREAVEQRPGKRAFAEAAGSGSLARRDRHGSVHGLLAKSKTAQAATFLKAHTCPYFEVARNHREICDMEQEMIADLLGPNVSISLADRIVDGACACDFHVSRVQSEPLEFVSAISAKEASE